MPQHDPVPDPDPLGRPLPPPRLSDRAVGLLTDLGLSLRGAVGAGAVVLVALLAWWWLRAPAPTPAEADVPMATAETALPAVSGPATTVPPAGSVWAHAAGAVRHPGLYELPAGSRVADLIDAAGGARPRADLDRVNLAEIVVDATQVYVPLRGEAGGAAAVPSAADPSGEAAPTIVNVNQAGPDELDTLPGVGPATAAAIIEYREANGPFASVDDLIDVPGIGDAKLAELRDLVSV